MEENHGRKGLNLRRKKNWFRETVFYQIWVRSFADGNGDGIGDLYGVYDKLDYLHDLGVDGIWFSPIYPSPNADFGYDISDYRNIHPDYGTLAQFRKVLNKAHELGIRVLMDLVANHTSDEHMWFQMSRRRIAPYTDYYIWRDEPNNWDSLFEGKAWEYDELRGQYYLHLFSKKQPDLNMDNPEVRREVREIMRFWLDMGVDGFREDVITFISKREGLPDGLPFVPVANAIMHYKDGPHVHEYLKEFRRIAEEYNAVQIGEGPMTTVQSAMQYLTGDTKSMDMMISFDHMLADCIYTEYLHLPFSLVRFKRAVSRWQTTLAGKSWNVLYLENHDHPRIISRYGSEDYWRESGTMLAMCYLFLQGTPFVYQGQEIGMTNIRLDSISDYIDVQSKGNYERLLTFEPEEKRLHRVHVSSRDSARTPVQWTAGKNAGFTTGEPWFVINPNYPQINVEAEKDDPWSILSFYKKCIALRKRSKTLLYGSYREFYPNDPHFYIYERVHDKTRYLIVCSFSEHEQVLEMPEPYRRKSILPIVLVSVGILVVGGVALSIALVFKVTKEQIT
ncbi:MAG: alpha-glucosidase, partial [Oscillospiraceae bacterium]|nr:alpha-glucosidase [Oscillospiraceae bacterium]